jgi:hypothetical protein
MFYKQISAITEKQSHNTLYQYSIMSSKPTLPNGTVQLSTIRAIFGADLPAYREELLSAVLGVIDIVRGGFASEF